LIRGKLCGIPRFLWDERAKIQTDLQPNPDTLGISWCPSRFIMTTPRPKRPSQRTARPTPATPSSKTKSSDTQALTILTIGHSTHPIDEFISMLQAHGVQQLVDVRTIPKSRRVPQFNQDALAKKLKTFGIHYIHLKALGGLRHAKKDSINLGWRNASFRGYADYISTDEFRAALGRLLELAHAKPTAIMCAEAVPWRCHRSLIGDALLVRGVQVEDIMSATSRRPHQLTPFARVQGHEITYPATNNETDSRQSKLPLTSANS
jgi:Protein of unknown function, DUF488